MYCKVSFIFRLFYIQIYRIFLLSISTHMSFTYNTMDCLFVCFALTKFHIFLSTKFTFATPKSNKYEMITFDLYCSVFQFAARNEIF